MEASEPKRRPSVWRFRTPEGRYVYDVNTNGFYRVSSAVYDALDPERDSDRRAELVARYREGAVADAECDIRASQASGVFLQRRPADLRFGTSLEGAREKLRSGQHMLTLCLTEFCNLRCSYCVYGGDFAEFRSHSTRRMSWETARKAIDLFLSSAAPQAAVTFYGGEPLSNLRLLVAAAAYARSIRPTGIGFALTTNGTLLSDRAADLIVRHDIEVMVSLDGPEAVHDANRRDALGRGTFDRILANLKELQRRHPDYYRSRIAFKVTYRDVLDLPRIRAFFRSRPDLFEGMRIRASLVNRPEEVSRPEGGSPPEDGGKAEAIWRAMASEYVDTLVSGSSPDSFLAEFYELDMIRLHQRPQTPMPMTLHPNGVCLLGAQRLFCTVDGDLLVCERVGETFKIGDVERGVDPDAALRLAETYAASSVAKGCCDCPAVRLYSSCFTSATARDGAAGADHSRCEGIRANLEHMMSIYCAIGEARPQALKAFDRA